MAEELAPDELFPRSPRVLYERSPLRSVVCQLRYPQILRIEASPPADFQERIREKFPIVQRVQPAGLEQVPPDVAQIMGLVQASATYHFRTEDGTATVALNPDFLALSTTTYSKWEMFRDFLEGPLNALIEIYRPSFFSRIGLRYSNTIKRRELGLGDKPWVDLLRSEILGELTLGFWEQSVTEARRQIRLVDTNGDGILLQHGLVGKAGNIAEEYLVDFDFYRDTKTEVGGALASLDEFHRRAGRAFRWCIQEPLHRAMGPSELQPDDH